VTAARGESDAPPVDRRAALLVARAQSGDRAALDAVLRALQGPALQGPLFEHARSIVGDDDGARDALQDALLIVSRTLPSLRDPRWLRAWAYRITTRACLRRGRRERPWREALRGEGLDALAAPDAEPRFDPELVAALPGQLAALPPGSGVVLRMHYLDGLTYVEIAEALEIAVGTVKSRLAYGLALLRRRLRPEATA
jgi:RNA polymerase sigma-70 factor, ECF subfamily